MPAYLLHPVRLLVFIYSHQQHAMCKIWDGMYHIRGLYSVLMHTSNGLHEA